MKISNSAIINNSTAYPGGGGGLINGYSGMVTISNSIFFGNLANFGGGLDNRGEMIVANSTIVGNLARGDLNFGGGILNSVGGITFLLSDIIADNIASSGSDIDILDTNYSIKSLGYNLISNGMDGRIVAVMGDQIGTSANPIDPMLSPLADNGGSTQTMAITSSSPAYQRGFCGGNSTILPAIPAVTTDQRGLPRKGTSTGCDVGAYEVQLPGSPMTLAATSTARN